ncbi:hypothetical protein Tsubulata_018757, partial [Turnera subulata]
DALLEKSSQRSSAHHFFHRCSLYRLRLISPTAKPPSFLLRLLRLLFFVFLLLRRLLVILLLRLLIFLLLRLLLRLFVVLLCRLLVLPRCRNPLQLGSRVCSLIFSARSHAPQGWHIE